MKALPAIAAAVLVTHIVVSGRAALQASDQKLPAGPGLAAKYPGDRGIENDPAVIYADGFESADLRRWDDQDGNQPPKVRLVQDRTAVHGGRQAVQLEAPPGKGAGADLVKMIAPGRDVVIATEYIGPLVER